MELNLYQELLLTAIFSLLIAFLIGKIAVAGASDRSDDSSVATDRTAPSASREKSEGSVAKSRDVFDLSSRSEGVRTEVAAYAKLPEADGVEVEEKEESLLYGEDEWEGIEKSEVEKMFSVAAEYVGSTSGASALARLSADVQMELYGLQKVATEGPCFESQPLPLNFSARAKWQAWQRLGNMAPEVAMEQYISFLSKIIPGWMEINSGEDDIGNDIPVTGIQHLGSPDVNLSVRSQLSSEMQSKSEDLGLVEIDSAIAGSKVLEQGLTSTFLLNMLSPTRGAFLSIFLYSG